MIRKILSDHLIYYGSQYRLMPRRLNFFKLCLGFPKIIIRITRFEILSQNKKKSNLYCIII